MDDLTLKQDPNLTQVRPEKHNYKNHNFEEELRQQNIKTMIEIYGKDSWENLRRISTQGLNLSESVN